MKTMKLKFVVRVVLMLALLLATFGIQNGGCQQAVDLVFTNKIVSFTNLQGEQFIAAELIEADATQVVFKTNDVFGAVKFTDLSKETRALIGIPESRLYLAHELEVQKQQAIANQRAILKQEQDDLDDFSKLTSLRINSVISKAYNPIYGWLQWCNVSSDSGMAGTCFIAKIPSSIQEYLTQKATLSESMATLNDQIDVATGKITAQTASLRRAQYQVDMANANPPTGAYTGDTATDNQIFQTVVALQNQNATRQVNIDADKDSLEDTKANVGRWRNQLDDEQKQFQDLTRDERVKLTLFVLKSHYTHNHLPILICAPQQVRRSGDSQ